MVVQNGRTGETTARCVVPEPKLPLNPPTYDDIMLPRNGTDGQIQVAFFIEPGSLSTAYADAVAEYEVFLHQG